MKKLVLLLIVVCAPLIHAQSVDFERLDFTNLEEEIQSPFSLDPHWFKWANMFFGGGTDKHGWMWYGQLDCRPIVFQDTTNYEWAARVGLHFGFDGSSGNDSNYQWDISSFEGGISLTYQRESWQILWRLSYRNLYQSGYTLSRLYKNKGQTNHQIHNEIVLEKFFEDTEWFSHWQLLITAITDIDSNKRSYWQGNRISQHDDPASNQSVYGGELNISVYDQYYDYEYHARPWFNVVPRITLGIYYNEWDQHIATKVGGGMRIGDVVYIDSGYTFNTGTNEDTFYLNFGLDVFEVIAKLSFQEEEKEEDEAKTKDF